MTGLPGLTVGTTLFSFTDEWRAGRWTLTGLLEEVAAQGLGPDVELVGHQSFRGLPTPTDEEVATFRADVERLGLRPSAYGVYVDRAARPGRWGTAEEGAAELAGQLRTAHRLGFPTVRGVLGTDLAVVDRVVPLLDELGLVLTFEVQGPHRPESPDVVALLAWLEGHPGSPVGLTLDSSVAMPDLPASYRRVLRRLGATPAVEDALETAWRADGTPFARLAAFREAAGEVSPALWEQAVTAFLRFGCGRLEDWVHVLPWVRHAHAKLWDWEDPERHVLGPHRAFLALLTEAGVAGSVSSELGGIAWLDRDGIDAVEVTRQHTGFLRDAVAA